MAKSNKSFICQNCGSQHSKWQGQCHICKEWNTIHEEIIEIKSSTNWKTSSENFISTPKNPIAINKISLSKEFRLPSNNLELDRVLGGGLIPGSVTLLGGEPLQQPRPILELISEVKKTHKSGRPKPNRTS